MLVRVVFPSQTCSHPKAGVVTQLVKVIFKKQANKQTTPYPTPE